MASPPHGSSSLHASGVGRRLHDPLDPARSDPVAARTVSPEPPPGIDHLLWRFSTPEQRRDLLADSQLSDVLGPLRTLAADPDRFAAVVRDAFGVGADDAAVETLRQRLVSGDPTLLPSLRLVDSDRLGGASGAYVADDRTILLDASLVGTREGTRTLLEELGHALDHTLNGSRDAAGDEGEIFRRLASGERLDAATLSALRAENDHGTITLDGRSVAVEFRREAGGGYSGPDYPWNPGGVANGGAPARPDPPGGGYSGPDYPWNPGGVANGGRPDRPAPPPLDDETRHVHTVTTHFEAIFDDDVIGDGEERFAEVARGDGEAAIRERLRASGVEGSAVDATYADIVAATRFLVDDEPARNAFDAGDDDDPTDHDGRFTADDGRARLMALTAGSTHPESRAIRDDVIASFVAGEDDWRLPSVTDLEAAHAGETRLLGTLDARDRTTLVAAYVDEVTRLGLDDEVAGGAYGSLNVPPVTANGELGTTLRAAYADRAIELQLGAPRDSRVQPLAAMFAATALHDASDDERVALIRSLDGTVRVEEDGGVVREIGEAQLFAASLMIPPTVEPGPRYDVFHPIGGVEARFTLLDETVVALNAAAGDGGTFTPAESDFVHVAFNNASIGLHRSLGSGRTAADTFGTALAISLHGGDADAQHFHAERLAGIFRTESGVDLTVLDPDRDPATRQQILGTLLHGHETLDGTRRFWTADDFAEDGLATVIGDVTVGNARELRLELGEPAPTAAEERALRDIAATEQGRDLFGFGDGTSHSLRTQFTQAVLERGLDGTDFGDGDGFDHPAINAEYLVALARRADPGRSFADDELARLRAIGESEAGRRVIGLGAGIDDAGRARFIAETLEHGWTAETFALTEDPALNPEFTRAFAADHAALFVTGGERHDALAALASGNADAYVRTALALPAAGADPTADALVATIVDEIGQHRGDGAPLAVVPITLNTGSMPVDLLLFEVTDGDETRYVDLNGKHYADPEDWRDNNGLPPGLVAFSGFSPDGEIDTARFASPSAGDGLPTVTTRTKDYPDTWWEQHGGKVVTGVAIVGGALVIVGSLGTATPFVVAGGLGAGLTVGVGGYQLAEAGDELYRHHAHGGSISPNDPTARGAYLNLAEGTLTVFTAGTASAAFRGTRLGTAVMSRPALNAFVHGANRVDEAFAYGLNAYGAHQILTSDLPPDEQARQLALLGIYGSVDVLLPRAVDRVIGTRPQAEFRRDVLDVDEGLAVRTMDDVTAVLSVDGRIPTPTEVARVARLSELDPTLDDAALRTAAGAVAVDATLTPPELRRALDAGASEPANVVAVTELARSHPTLDDAALRTAAGAFAVDGTLSPTAVKRGLDSGATSAADVATVARVSALGERVPRATRLRAIADVLAVDPSLGAPDLRRALDALTDPALPGTVPSTDSLLSVARLSRLDPTLDDAAIGLAADTLAIDPTLNAEQLRRGLLDGASTPQELVAAFPNRVIGEPAEILPQMEQRQIDALTRENEAAPFLAAELGTTIERNPDVPGRRNPDFRDVVSGRTIDVYSPSDASVDGIVDGTNLKFTGGDRNVPQADDVLVNLADSDVGVAELVAAFADQPQPGTVYLLDRSGTITRVTP